MQFIKLPLRLGTYDNPGEVVDDDGLVTIFSVPFNEDTLEVSKFHRTMAQMFIDEFHGTYGTSGYFNITL